MNVKSRGVYIIRNNVNQKTYVGSTAGSFDKRWKEHKRLLENQEHTNPCLIRAWNKYGANSFAFLTLEDMPAAMPEEILESEQWYFDNVKTHTYNGGGYNMAKNVFSSFAGRLHTDQSKSQIGAKHRGRKVSAETREKMRQANLGKKYSEEVNAKKGSPGKSNPNYGKPLSDKRKAGVSKMLKQRHADNPNIQRGENNPNSKLTANQVLFSKFLRNAWGITYKEIGTYFGVTRKCIFDAVIGKTWKHLN